jgi:hypothetical protein
VSHRTEAKGQYAYAKIHQDPVLYRTLYTYLCARLSTPSELRRAVEQLYRWEKVRSRRMDIDRFESHSLFQSFHGETALDAFACWRLHLGSTKVLKTAYRSIQTPGMFTQFHEKYQPIKDRLRRVRQTLREEVKEPSERLYAATNIAFYLLKPFCDAACFYFDVAKGRKEKTYSFTILSKRPTLTYLIFAVWWQMPVQVLFKRRMYLDHLSGRDVHPYNLHESPRSDPQRVQTG